LSSIEEKPSLCFVAVHACDLEVEHLLLSDHYLQTEVGLKEVQLFFPASGVCGDLRLSRVLEEHDKTLARLVVGLLYRATEAPPIKGLLVY
jgi:hypothetical protein